MVLKDGPSNNWLALQKKFQSTSPSTNAHSHSRKRRKISQDPVPTSAPTASTSKSSIYNPPASTTRKPHAIDPALLADATTLNGECLGDMRKLIYGLLPASPVDLSRSKYLALDCEMVGIGPGGKESSLARVSIVDYNGAVVLDEFVRQRERVTDWRTAFSGVRERDMINAKPFDEIQARVADLLKGRILVGHAVHNDLKVLFLSHPRAEQRDTQHLAHKNGQSRGAHPALRNLVRDMFSVQIQGGEHSSVTDARATMAVFRLHRKQWERAYSTMPIRVNNSRSNEVKGKSRAHTSMNRPEGGTYGEGANTTTQNRQVKFAAKRKVVHSVGNGGRKGVSSGLSTIITKRSKGGGGGGGGGGGDKSQWWKELGGGAKGALSLSR